ncbi:MAG: VWA domain-containing protein, partial [Desulfobacteraceae bacterium]|nr:VWA domain-containing protein [Desulfobacteraceae bacterium]
MKRIAICGFIISLLLAAFASEGTPSSPCSGSLNPPFIASGAKPNILIILDNSNSMDEDFYGNAVGSYSPASKSVIAKQALQTLIAGLQTKANVGLMTYSLPDNTQKYFLYNMPYFVSYD